MTPLPLRHWPGLAPRPAHAAPAPQLVTPQQTPSAQCADLHCRSSVQGLPSSCAPTHAPALQKLPAAQSSSFAHAVRHVVVPHWYAPHVRWTIGQWPPPSQVVTSVSVPPAHAGVPQETAFGALWHASASVPSQLRPHTASPTLVLHAACPGFGCPTTGTQVPSLPETPHASHEPVQPVSQQKLSTQWLEAHSLLVLHALPCSFAQWPALEVDALHDAPTPQLALPQQTPLVQKPLGHADGSVHGTPSPSIGTQNPPLQ
jgi:hypothetical protein